jgi:ERCC4-type nuclease
LVEVKAKKKNISLVKKRLEVGDYIINDVCFEAKSSHDFMASIMNKRIWTQLDNMDRCYPRNFVVIYGTIDEALKFTKYTQAFDKMPKGSKEQILGNKFKGAIGRIMLDTDVNVIWTRTEAEAAEQLITLAKMAPVERPAIRPSVPKRTATTDVRVDLLTIIKGVSEKKAKLLLKQFGSIMEIGEHKASDISKLDGMGDTVAHRILKILKSEGEIKQ